MLDVFLNNTDVVLTIDLVDASGNALNVNSVAYRVVDQDGTELVAQGPLSGFTAGDAQATVTVSAVKNQLGAGNVREVRTVELLCATDAGTVGLVKSYGIEALDPLKVPDNSFMTYPMAEMMAMSIPNLAAYNAASEQEKIAALMDAREHICQLNFGLLNSNANFSQDQLSYVPEGEFQSSYVARNSLFLFNGNLALLNQTQFNTLPEKFKRALRQAQVVEANAILGGEADDNKRAAGIVEEAIGETRVKYGQGAALRLPVCRRALGYLSYYVTFAKRIGRA